MNDIDYPVDLLSYWNKYYRLNKIPQVSNFAETALEFTHPGEHMIDLGCGNGGDSLFFSSHGLFVTAVDLSADALDNLKSNRDASNIRIRQEDFVCGRSVANDVYDIYYSRWTLHSITEESQEQLLYNIHRQAEPGARVLVEARSYNDDLYGKGKCVGRDAFVERGHYRRFLKKDEFLAALLRYGFAILYSAEGRGFSVREESDPVLLRVVAEKMEEL